MGPYIHGAQPFPMALDYSRRFFIQKQLNTWQTRRKAGDAKALGV
jgi:hypothetical protein